MKQCSHILAQAHRLKATVSIAAVIGETLQLHRDGSHLMALCPFHKERTPSLCIYRDHYHCFGCSAHGDVFAWLMQSRRMTFPQAIRHLEGRPSPDQIVERPTAKLKVVNLKHSRTAGLFLRCWNEGVDPRGTIVQDYLANRGGLTIPEGAPIRFHRHCQRGTKDMEGGPDFWPAMLALMTDPITGKPVGVHRTFLLPDGSTKAPRRGRLKPKMILGTWGVVRLAPDREVGRALAVTEGIENALTAMQIIGWGPTWAVGTQACVREFPVLPWIEAVSIFADADDGGVGLTAARTCADRWHAADREALIHIPPDGDDWNDAANRLVA